LVRATSCDGYCIFSIARIESTIVSASLYAETQIVTGGVRGERIARTNASSDRRRK